MKNVVKIFVALVVIVSSIFAHAMPVAATDPYEVNVSLGLTGQGALLGSQIRVSLHLIEARTNKEGGIKGRRSNS